MSTHLRDWPPTTAQKPRLRVLEVRSRVAPDALPIASVLVERQEAVTYSGPGGSVCTSSIHLHYERLLPGHAVGTGNGCFAAHCVQTPDGAATVKLCAAATAGDAVFLDLPGLEGNRIGTYLMNEIVEWAARWPMAEVGCIELDAGLAIGENHARRNRFCEQFGLEFDFADADRREGLSLPIRAGALNPVHTWRDNIRERDARQHVADILLDLGEVRRERDHALRVNEALATQLGHAKARPVRWALTRMWQAATRWLAAGVAAVIHRLGRPSTP
ncbi:hypothetical protein [Rhizobacter sp. Root1221]|uniref:hypothetical protein n=1 Tax=Rhizobacter sp. Root1221 TaxID=1736433 RepID=UPI0006F5325E|nr:hypothetical protein [Rhizobacter sp. Root1221]KQW01254.1 hypothetical protein ASC87_15300 [Rhizobacter sp. Root1221]